MKLERALWIAGAIIFSFSACFLSSVLAKDYLGMDVDFLSSGATLAAALVAVLLFNDWREQYLVSSIEKQQSEIVGLCDLLFENYMSMVIFSVKNKKRDPIADEGILLGLMEQVQRLDNNIFKLRIAFNNYQKLLVDFEDTSKKHIAEIKKYEGFLITIQSFVDALQGVENSRKITEVYNLHFERNLSKDLNHLWNSCKGEMQGFLISLLKK